jgi:hypothetical protein
LSSHLQDYLGEEEGEEKVVDFYPVFCFLWKENRSINIRHNELTSIQKI